MTLSPRINAKPAIVLATVLAAACTATALGQPSDPGGTSYPAASSGQVGSTALHAPGSALLGRWVRFSGTVSPGSAVRIQRRDARQGWVTEATTTAGRDGSYGVGWRTDRPGVVAIRAVAGTELGAHAAAAAAPIRMTVFKPARATWYGPGFYGRRTACGLKMTRTLVGVAHRSLPCGTKVTLYYRGRTLRVPVVDRGPYGTGASWDITAAAAQQLGFTGSDRIGALAPGL